MPNVSYIPNQPWDIQSKVNGFVGAILGMKEMALQEQKNQFEAQRVATENELAKTQQEVLRFRMETERTNAPLQQEALRAGIDQTRAGTEQTRNQTAAQSAMLPEQLAATRQGTRTAAAQEQGYVQQMSENEKFSPLKAALMQGEIRGQETTQDIARGTFELNKANSENQNKAEQERLALQRSGVEMQKQGLSQQQDQLVATLTMSILDRGGQNIPAIKAALENSANPSMKMVAQSLPAEGFAGKPENFFDLFQSMLQSNDLKVQAVGANGLRQMFEVSTDPNGQRALLAQYSATQGGDMTEAQRTLQQGFQSLGKRTGQAPTTQPVTGAFETQGGSSSSTEASKAPQEATELFKRVFDHAAQNPVSDKEMNSGVGFDKASVEFIQKIPLDPKSPFVMGKVYGNSLPSVQLKPGKIKPDKELKRTPKELEYMAGSASIEPMDATVGQHALYNAMMSELALSTKPEGIVAEYYPWLSPTQQAELMILSSSKLKLNMDVVKQLIAIEGRR